MGKLEIILIAVALSMDAFAASICKGLSMKSLNIKKSIKISLYFGIFQAIMPCIGYFLGANFESLIIRIDHWVAFILLGVLGINMIKEASNLENSINDCVDFKAMLPLAISTSIDALAVGITFSFLKVNIYSSTIIIGLITTVLTFCGVIIGNKFGKNCEKEARIIGGLILISLGVKILFDHLF